MGPNVWIGGAGARAQVWLLWGKMPATVPTASTASATLANPTTIVLRSNQPNPPHPPQPPQGQGAVAHPAQYRAITVGVLVSGAMLYWAYYELGRNVGSYGQEIQVRVGDAVVSKPNDSSKHLSLSLSLSLSFSLSHSLPSTHAGRHRLHHKLVAVGRHLRAVGALGRLSLLRPLLPVLLRRLGTRGGHHEHSV